MGLECVLPLLTVSILVGLVYLGEKMRRNQFHRDMMRELQHIDAERALRRRLKEAETKDNDQI